MNKRKLKAGSRVKVVQVCDLDTELAGIETGDTGTIIDFGRYACAVLMDRPINGHNAGQRTNTRQAWYFLNEKLQMIPPTE